ncbi:MAG: hypothetical protein WDW36_005225 [Sanguina aurantia]
MLPTAKICRCLPFIHRIHNMDEVLSLRDLRAIVKEQFAQYKDVKDPRVVNMLVFKGREELETYLMRHKQRHHAITEYVEPYIKKRDNIRKLSGTSSFLDTFFETGYPQIPRKWN